MVNLVDVNELLNDLVTYKIRRIEGQCYEIINKKEILTIEVLTVDFVTKSMSIRYKHRIFDLSFKNNLDKVLDQLGIKRASDLKSTSIKAPMPGKVLEIVAKEGDKIEKGDAILILEAMKMENVLKAESDCTIKKVLISNEENVEKNQVLIELD